MENWRKISVGKGTFSNTRDRLHFIKFGLYLELGFCCALGAILK